MEKVKIISAFFIKKLQMPSIIAKYHLKLGNWVTLVWCLYVTLRTCVSSHFVIHSLFMTISFALVYISMMLIWLLVFAFLPDIKTQNGFYKRTEICRIFMYCVALIVPFLAIGYYIEIIFVKDIQKFDTTEFIVLYALRMVFEFGLVLTFKYLMDSREAAKNYLEETHKLQEANTKAQFDILKQQVNPHFLFNALSTLKSLIRMQDSRAEEFVMSLSDVYRKLLQRRDKELIRLSDELEIVDAYLFMQQLRFEKNLIVHNTIDTNALELFIPPFALQLLIENTIKHNIISQRKPLTIRIFVRDRKQIVVENTMQPKKTSEESTGWGLSSIIERYICFTKTPIDIHHDEHTFSVALPLLMEV
jgi:two-component system, LytTR family, sensor kinase